MPSRMENETLQDDRAAEKTDKNLIMTKKMVKRALNKIKDKYRKYSGGSTAVLPHGDRYH